MITIAGHRQSTTSWQLETTTDVKKTFQRHTQAWGLVTTANTAVCVCVCAHTHALMLNQWFTMKGGASVLCAVAVSRCLLTPTRLPETRRHANRQRDTTCITAQPPSRSTGLSVSLASSQILSNYEELMGYYCTLSNCWNILEGQKILLPLAHPQRRDYSPKLEWGERKKKKKISATNGDRLSAWLIIPIEKSKPHFPDSHRGESFVATSSLTL